MSAQPPLSSLPMSGSAVASSGPAAAATSPALYEAWLGLVPQLFAQLGLPASSGAKAPLEAASSGATAPLEAASNGAKARVDAALHGAHKTPVDAADPLAAIAHAATLTMSSLQDLQRVYAPMLQVAGGPGLLGHLATALAAADPSIPAHPHAAHPGALLGIVSGPAALQVWVDGFDRTFGALSDAIGLAPAQRLQRAVGDLAAAAVADGEARAAYATQLQLASAKGFERLLERLAQTAGSGGRIDGVLPLMKMWAACSEEAAHEVLQSGDGLAARVALSRASVARRAALQEVAAIVSGSLDLATRKELEEAFRALELGAATQKLERGLRRMAELPEEQLAIATVPRDEVYREDMMRLYRARPVVERPLPVPILITYALVGRYQMIDLEADRSLVRKLLARGFDVYFIDWGLPTRAQRWLTIDDYVSGCLDRCVDEVRERSGAERVNLLGICQGGVFSTCYAALYPQKVRNLAITVTPIDFHGDRGREEAGSGYMNRWARTLTADDIDKLVDTYGAAPGSMVGMAFLMMSPLSNMTKYTIDLIDVLDDDAKLVNFLRMERWIADRPDHPGEVVRQWFKDLYQDNKLIRGELELGGRTVDLGAITVPVLNIYTTGDTVVPVACSQGVGQYFGTDDYAELAVPGGHIGTFVGGKAQKVLAPSLADWFEARSPKHDEKSRAARSGAGRANTTSKRPRSPAR